MLSGTHLHPCPTYNNVISKLKPCRSGSLRNDEVISHSPIARVRPQPHIDLDSAAVARATASCQGQKGSVEMDLIKSLLSILTKNVHRTLLKKA